MAEVVIEFMTAKGWDIYQEVDLGQSRPVVDIVGVRGGVHWIVECKLSLSMALMEQAWRLKPWAELVSIATPDLKCTKGHTFAQHALRRDGLGWLRAKADRVCPDTSIAALYRKNQLWPGTARHVGTHLRDAQKTGCAAGTNGGGYHTRFKETVRQLIEYVTANPGCTLGQALRSIDHHYQTIESAKSSIRKYVSDDIVKGIVIKNQGGILRAYPDGAAPDVDSNLYGKQTKLEI